MALEDAVVLARELGAPVAVRAASTSRQPWRRSSGCARARLGKMARSASRNRDAKTAGPVAARIRDLVMPVMFNRMYERATGWLYDFDPGSLPSPAASSATARSPRRPEPGLSRAATCGRACPGPWPATACRGRCRPGRARGSVPGSPSPGCRRSAVRRGSCGRCRWRAKSRSGAGSAGRVRRRWRRSRPAACRSRPGRSGTGTLRSRRMCHVASMACSVMVARVRRCTGSVSGRLRRAAGHDVLILPRSAGAGHEKRPGSLRTSGRRRGRGVQPRQAPGSGTHKKTRRLVMLRSRPHARCPPVGTRRPWDGVPNGIGGVCAAAGGCRRVRVALWPS